MELTLNATNLTDATLTQNFQFDGAPNYWYKAGTTISIGIRGKF
jgi:hypothetical protein